MQRSEVESKLQEIHRENGYDTNLVLNHTFDEQGYDSLDKVEFVMHAEKEFDISIDDALFEGVKTPNDAIELILEAVGQTS